MFNQIKKPNPILQTFKPDKAKASLKNVKEVDLKADKDKQTKNQKSVWKTDGGQH